ncbi:SLC13 family permease [Natronospirillum operosum]|uniref:SLC13 family permease n=1 Tax=Natronospirillum operosum TaxID=2759953 RepID=A0A4Z0WJ17_9GAMM|nr:SLC13 family permease [Natronospirillum operosum]TGG95856.1 SLC13 family permease [Natronospirillum operosum]
MTWQALLTLAVIVSVLGTMMLTRIAPHWVMMAALTVLSAAGILSPELALSGFSNPGLITVAAMFIIATGMYQSGAVDQVVRHALGHPGSIREALLRIFLPVISLSGFLNNTPVVATMIPAIRAWSKKIGISPSRLLMPLSYAAILGGTLTLIGTSTNLIVNGQYQALTGEAGFSIFSITWLGLPVAIVGGFFMWLVFPRLLPEQPSKELIESVREFTVEVRVDPQGPLVGKSVAAAGLRHLRQLYLVEIERDDSVVTAVPSEERLQGNDTLVFAGETEAITELLRIPGIRPASEISPGSTLTKDREERRLVEAVVSPNCDGIGQTIRDSRFHDRYGAIVLAVARNGKRLDGNLGQIKLAPGDVLLLEARPAFVSRQRYQRDFLLINDLQEQAPQHDRHRLAWLILVGVVLSAATGLASMLNAALIGAGLMIALNCCSFAQAQRSLDLSVIITIGASFALGNAMLETGLAQSLAMWTVETSLGKPWLLLILTYLVVSVLTESITNNASAILMLPIVLAVTGEANLNAEPFVFAIMMAASASFATPLGYQTNLMVYGPGNYRFTDFLRLGLPMNLIVGATAVSLILWRMPLAA